MYLSTVNIRNFRSLKELKVSLQPGLNVVVGRNNTGKTNLLHAIRHALGPASSRGDALWLERDDFYRESATDDMECTISITLTFAGLSENQRAQFFEIVSFNLADITQSTAVVRYEASWPKGKRQASIRRTGGPEAIDPPEIPAKILESLPVTFLPALRDAEASLAPGSRSRLARLLRDLARRQDDDPESEIKAIYARANEDLEIHPLIKDTRDSLQSTTKNLAGTDYFASAIRAVPADFDRILRSLQVTMDGVPIGALDANGLGYNNLLYIAVVLEHLKSPDVDECPLLLVEEPEAHLHPQLTMLLADYLSNNTPGKNTPQTVITTHSPTLAAGVAPGCVRIMHADAARRVSRCNSISDANMDDKEHRELQRMMDITRATLYFAKAAILVEGISESLLIPVLARRLGYNLAKLHVSVIPICGVAFETFSKLLSPDVLGIPVAIVTDADPLIERGQNWEQDMPQPKRPPFTLSDRTTRLQQVFGGNPMVKVFHSALTLEYDLAEAGDENADVMAEVWESCFKGAPSTFNRSRIAVAGASKYDKAIATWRGICRAQHSGSKAEFAHRLAAHLAEVDATGQLACIFETPTYLKMAIEHVVGNSGLVASSFTGDVVA